MIDTMIHQLFTNSPTFQKIASRYSPKTSPTKAAGSSPSKLNQTPTSDTKPCTIPPAPTIELVPVAEIFAPEGVDRIGWALKRFDAVTMKNGRVLVYLKKDKEKI